MVKVCSLRSNLKLELKGDILVVIMEKVCSLPSNLKRTHRRCSSCDHGRGLLSTKQPQT